MGTIIDGINWGTRTFDPRRPIAKPVAKLEPEPEPIMEAEPAPQPIAEPEPEKEIDIIEVMPWEPMPEGYKDYRPLLQRDGLFLYAWTIWEDGSIVASWKRTSGKMRSYSSPRCREESLESVVPTKSMDGYRGIAWETWHSKERPDIAVFTAPRYIVYYERDAFLTRLRGSGATNNFDYQFTIAKQKAGIKEIKAPTVTERLIDLVHRSLSNPTNAGEYIEYFFDSIIADGTVDRWEREKAEREKGKSKRRKRA